MALNKKFEIFVVHVIVLKTSKLAIQLSQLLHLVLLQQKKALTKILPKYSNYVNISSPDLIIEELENTSINNYTIKLIEGKQSPYRPIYSLGLIMLKMLKAYIKTQLKTGFIWPYKFFRSASILFDKKPYDNLCLYVNYQSLNNLTIKNRYTLPLNANFLDQLRRAKQSHPVGPHQCLILNVNLGG